jgi:S-formylglutathione hydrolase FrmB
MGPTRRILAMGLLGVFAVSFAVPGVTAQDWGDPGAASRPPLTLSGGASVRFLDFESEALHGRGQYSIFLPPSYQGSDRTYPVLYFLHGLFNDHTSWTDSEYGNIPARVEQLMLDGKIPEMILVHPNGGRSFYTNYHDGRLRYEDFVVQELVAHVEGTYRARTGRTNRAIAGTSMGGYGALKIAMKYPNLYAAVVAQSPIVFLTKNPLDVPPALRENRRFAFFNEIFSTVFGDPLDQAYYDANNPLFLARSQNLDGIAIYFDYGTADRYNELIQLGRGLQSLDRILTEEGVAHEFHEHSGEPHGWALVAAHLPQSLAFASQTFEEPAGRE